MPDVLARAKSLTLDQIGQLGLAEARDYREALLEEINAIEARLGSSKLEYPRPDDYADWRRRTLDAKRHMATKYRALKNHIIDLNAQAAVLRADVDVNGPHELVHALADLVRRLRNDGVELSGREIDLLIAAEEYTKNNPL